MNSVHLLLIAAIISTGDFSTSEHQFVFKRFHRGLMECAKILRIPETTVDQAIQNKFRCDEQTKHLVHCVMVQLHTWDDDTGLWRSAISQFFEPNAYEGLFEIRTDTCLATDLAFVNKCDVITQAYVTFDCFYREYGYLAENVHFVIFKQLQLKSVMSASLDIANVPQSALRRLTVDTVFSVPEAHCLLYIFSLRAGFYNDIGGVLLYSLYSQFGNETLVQLGKITCIEKLLETAKFADRCGLVNAVFDLCLMDAIPISQLIMLTAEHLLVHNFG